MEIFSIIGFTLSGFLCILILTKKRLSLSDKVLCGWFIIMIIVFVLYYFRFAGIDQDFPHLKGLETSLILTIAPMIYFYVITLTDDHKLKWGNVIPHLAPFILINIYLIGNFYFLSAQEKINLFKLARDQSRFSLIDAFVKAQYLVYFFLSKRILQRRMKLNQTEDPNMTWLKIMVNGFGIVYVINLSLWIYWLTLPSNPNDLLGKLSIMNFSLLFVLIALVGVKQSNIFLDVGPAFKQRLPFYDKYKKSSLDTDLSIEYAQLITSAMQERKLYRHQNLNLNMLAKELEIQPHHLSQTLNQQEGKTFYEFINEYRIKEVKQKLLDPENDHLKIIAIAFETGFNSKSVFNQVFKKETGKTPSEYRKNHQQT